MPASVNKSVIPSASMIANSASQFHDDEILTTEVIRNYTYLIGSHIIYFNQLSPVQKLRFIKRVKAFMATKVFHYMGIAANPEIPILISASAIQLTFGLKNFHLSHFKNIYVLGDAYRMDEDEEYFIGHVEPEGIYLSWKHFLYGYAISDDNINVALHEMAHALLYNNFYTTFGTDAHFRLNYECFSSSTGPIIAQILTGRRSYLRGYAFTNIQEFWAVSVEAFFENPKQLKLHMPSLFKALCTVLNQDPMTKNKIISNTYP